MRLISLPGVGSEPDGNWVGLSLPRRFICDLLAFARLVPSVPTQRTMQLADVIAARRRQDQRISWCAIFIKAYAIVAARRPELRRAYMPWIWPHLYEHPVNIASFSVEREYGGEEAVFFGQIRQPELLSLREIDAIIRRHKVAPLDEIPQFRRALLLSSLPLPIRRLAWWLGLRVDGAHRAHFFGTFGISVVASIGAAGLHLLSPLSTTVNYGALRWDGSLDVRLTYDHRVLDGANAARAMAELEEVLHGEILQELAADQPALSPDTDRRPGHRLSVAAPQFSVC
ncbi:MAG: hypothetical protein KF708_23630 [Pirellulales bacterium]|nr:hypothetical protein [Pirellulales bacterium]